jgi:hypothetical protein
VPPERDAAQSQQRDADGGEQPCQYPRH